MKRAIIAILLIALAIAALSTVANKGWWMRRVRAKFHYLPWPPVQDAEKVRPVKLSALIKLYRTDIQGAVTGQVQGPQPPGVDNARDKLLREAGFRWEPPTYLQLL